MNDYTEMLQVFADKFGTTVEHLWGVMIYQAPISATIDIITAAGCVAFLVWGYKAIKKKTVYPNPEWDVEGATLAWLVWGFAVIGAYFVVMCNVESAVTGYLNPEYWALMKLKH